MSREVKFAEEAMERERKEMLKGFTDLKDEIASKAASNAARSKALDKERAELEVCMYVEVVI